MMAVVKLNAFDVLYETLINSIKHHQTSNEHHFISISSKQMLSSYAYQLTEIGIELKDAMRRIPFYRISERAYEDASHVLFYITSYALFMFLIFICAFFSIKFSTHCVFYSFYYTNVVFFLWFALFILLIVSTNAVQCKHSNDTHTLTHTESKLSAHAHASVHIVLSFQFKLFHLWKKRE